MSTANPYPVTDEMWTRHANPWSVWTRFAGIPASELAVWSRDWIGWWSLAGVAVVLIWMLWLNVRVFRPVGPTGWTARGIYGERLHVEGKAPKEHQTVLRLLVIAGLAGMAFIAWGLIALDIWPLVLGTTVLILAQLWRIDRYGLLFSQQQAKGDLPGCAVVP